MLNEIYISEAVHESLEAAAIELQSQIALNSGAVYTAADLKSALVKWLEGSIEQLAEDALFHVREGQNPFAFNRAGFDRELNKLQPVEVEPVREPIAA